MRYLDRNIDYISSIRVCDVIESSSIKTNYYNDTQIKTLRNLQYFINVDEYDIVLGCDKTIRLESIRDRGFRHITINTNGSLLLYRCE